MTPETGPTSRAPIPLYRSAGTGRYARRTPLASFREYARAGVWMLN